MALVEVGPLALHSTVAHADAQILPALLALVGRSAAAKEAGVRIDMDQNQGGWGVSCDSSESGLDRDESSESSVRKSQTRPV